MANNLIEIHLKADGDLLVSVWDNDGVEHDISSIFASISGALGKGVCWNQLNLQRANSGVEELQTQFNFTPKAKHLRYSVSKEVVTQILAAAHK
jgi:hypothetical protein